jgi:hypothetical protein
MNTDKLMKELKKENAGRVVNIAVLEELQELLAVVGVETEIELDCDIVPTLNGEDFGIALHMNEDEDWGINDDWVESSSQYPYFYVCTPLLSPPFGGKHFFAGDPSCFDDIVAYLKDR